MHNALYDALIFHSIQFRRFINAVMSDPLKFKAVVIADAIKYT